MRAGALADALGYDDVWSWDHLVPIKGDPSGPIHEGMMTLAGWAPVTHRARLGLMVAANTFRSPTLLVKMVTALDHMTGGRAVLGLGAAWFEDEHRRFGFEFGSGPPERLRWLDEAAELVRGMLGGETVSARGERYSATMVANRPGSVQARIPLLIGGGGERRTLATVARYADAWNIGEPLDVARRKVAALEDWCARVGRNPAEIERTLGVGAVVIRDRAADGRRVADALGRHNGGWGEDIVIGDSEAMVARLAPYLDLGFRAFHIDLPAPFDEETLRRFAQEVVPALRAVAGVPAGGPA
jgi:alkanesulfonate monooxygenase SsuD/methylene tetrahydromethanopterin reductase-like flavin-dependent oxidoreductase (luciferase family)